MMMHYCTNLPIECVEEQRQDKSYRGWIENWSTSSVTLFNPLTVSPPQAPFPENRVATSLMTRRGYVGVSINKTKKNK